MTSALVIGAGIVGCASALRLAQRGVQVTVLERGRIGEHAASTAAAGMLGAQLEAHPVASMQALCVESRARYAAFVAEVGALGGGDVELRFCGALRVAATRAELDAIERDASLQVARGYDVELLDDRGVAATEPSLTGMVGGALYRGDGIVEPRTLLAAVRAAAAQVGVRFEERCDVRAFTFDPRGRIDGVQLADDTRRADRIVLAAGSWSTRIEGVDRVLAPPTVEPVRGQMLELRDEPFLRCVVEGAGAYLSPRRDGRVLVGSTMERVGFERAVTAGAAADLLAAAVRMVPRLAGAQLTDQWCGFRAATPDGLPIFGRADDLVVATGHFRNGIVLAPISAEVVTALVLEESPPVDITPFSIERFSSSREIRREQERQHGHVS